MRKGNEEWAGDGGETGERSKREYRQCKDTLKGVGKERR